MLRTGPEFVNNTHPDHEPARPRARHRPWGLIIAIVVTLAIFGGIGFYYHVKKATVLPHDVQAAADFPLYYPSPEPTNYKLQKGSPQYENGVVFYTLSNGSSSIKVSEQAIPAHPPDLANLSGFKKLSTLAGDVAVGSNFGQPVAILLTNTTLVTITSSGPQKVPQDVIVQTAQRMTSLPN